jgi:hypothetical protein
MLHISPNFVHYKEYMDEEVELIIKRKTQFNRISRVPPPRDKKIVTEKLSDRAINIIQRACRNFRYWNKEVRGKSGKCTFITLTYPDNHPSDELSKKHLEHFIKRIRRKNPDFMYLWVAERQERGAIHYHMVTPDYTPKEWINKSWFAIVEKWYKSIGMELEVLLPHVEGVDNIAGYMTKYLRKDNNRIEGNRYNLSKNARKLIEPLGQLTFRQEEGSITETLRDVLHDGEKIPHNEVKVPINEELGLLLTVKFKIGKRRDLLDRIKGCAKLDLVMARFPEEIYQMN